MVWNRLDRFFVNNSLSDGRNLDVIAESYRIVSEPLNSKDYQYTNRQYPSYGSRISQTPHRAELDSVDPETAGYSKHNTIYVEFRLQ